MAARCPHYRSECTDPRSRSCLHVKQATHAAFVSFHQLRALAKDNVAVDPKMQEHIDRLGKFIADSRM